jgi:hypothetical protein
MHVWSVVVLLLKRQLNSMPWCLLVCNLVVYCVVVLFVVMERTVAITGDPVGLFQDFSLRRKIWGNYFPKVNVYKNRFTKSML